MATEFHTLGEHCSVDSCNQHDFLPVKCGGCGLMFCSGHMSLSSHSCPNTDALVVCKESGKDEKVGEDGDAALAPEVKQDCSEKEESEKKRPKKKRCVVRRCKANLSMLGTTCNYCDQDVCFAHRLEKDHNCPKTNTTFAKEREEEKKRKREKTSQLEEEKEHKKRAMRERHRAIETERQRPLSSPSPNQNTTTTTTANQDFRNIVGVGGYHSAAASAVNGQKKSYTPEEMKNIIANSKIGGL
jgi:AN1-type zinc finger protein 2